VLFAHQVSNRFWEKKISNESNGWENWHEQEKHDFGGGDVDCGGGSEGGGTFGIVSACDGGHAGFRGVEFGGADRG
jgi:hypothetical protein